MLNHDVGVGSEGFHCVNVVRVIHLIINDGAVARDDELMGAGQAEVGRGACHLNDRRDPDKDGIRRRHHTTR